MLLLANIDLDSSQGRNSNVLLDDILLSQNAIFFMNVVDLMGIGIRGEIL